MYSASLLVPVYLSQHWSMGIICAATSEAMRLSNGASKSWCNQQWLHCYKNVSLFSFGEILLQYLPCLKVLVYFPRQQERAIAWSREEYTSIMERRNHQSESSRVIGAGVGFQQSFMEQQKGYEITVLFRQRSMSAYDDGLPHSCVLLIIYGVVAIYRHVRSFQSLSHWTSLSWKYRVCCGFGSAAIQSVEWVTPCCALWNGLLASCIFRVSVSTGCDRSFGLTGR